MPGKEAITKACPERLRPVLMTALSAVFGMIPVAIATSDAAEWRNELGALIIGGLSTSTLLTLIVIPAAYMLPTDASRIAGIVANYFKSHAEKWNRASLTAITKKWVIVSNKYLHDLMARSK